MAIFNIYLKDKYIIIKYETCIYCIKSQIVRCDKKYDKKINPQIGHNKSSKTGNKSIIHQGKTKFICL